jgi:NADH-ubiquinone oxidoreductase chain 6
MNNGYYVFTLDIVYTLTIFSAIFVITNKNPIISILFLIGLFVVTSTYLLLLGLDFLGLSYLLVYVGAVSILFLFILMLINIRISELYTDSANSIPLTIMVLVICITYLSTVLPSSLSEGRFLFIIIELIETITSIDLTSLFTNFGIKIIDTIDTAYVIASS